MHVFLAWFAERPLPETMARAALERFDANLAEVVPSTFLRSQVAERDWGLIVLEPPDRAAYRWPARLVSDSITAVSDGLPVGVDVSGGPAALAARLLAGEDVHRDVVPPFALLAIDAAAGRFSLQQDWLGMSRVFTATSGGLTAFCTRPSALAAFMNGDVKPDLDGWRSYALSGHFGGDLSPILGTRLLSGGERVVGRRETDGGWHITTETRFNVDDVVAAGLAGAHASLDELLDGAAHALNAVGASIPLLYEDVIPLGLSGGKDSRLLAATLLAAGVTPRYTTSEDTAAEGEVARELVRILREKRGLQPEHQLHLSGAPEQVLDTGLVERTMRLQRLDDYQRPATYIARPAVSARLEDRLRPASFTGAFGEIATGYWYPREEGVSPEQEAVAKLVGAVPRTAADDDAVAAEQGRVALLLDHARHVGLHDMHLLDYLYLVERARRWATSATVIGQITPLLAPGFVGATFGLTPEQKRARLLHLKLIDRLVPEWSEVPFVSRGTGQSTATRVWEGDGVEAIAGLLDTAHGPITRVLQRSAVEEALRRVVKRGRADPRILQQFTWLAVASHQLEPGDTRPASGATYARIVPAPRPVKPSPPLVGRLRWVRRTRLGNRIWVEVRKRVRR